MLPLWYGRGNGDTSRCVDVFAEVDSVANTARPFGSRSYGGRATAMLFAPRAHLVSAKSFDVEDG